jgi:hypothetical protein
MQKIISLLLLFSFSTLSIAICQDDIKDISFSSGEALVTFDTGKTLKILADIEPGFLEYSYKILDINQDGKNDIVIIENNDINSNVMVFDIKNKKPSLTGIYSDIRYSKMETCLFIKNENLDIYINTYINSKKSEYSPTDSDYDFILNHCTSISSIYP